ncbi:MAG: hypothetical protein ABIF87_06660 [Pseudomonadota bacterium]
MPLYVRREFSNYMNGAFDWLPGGQQEMVDHVLNAPMPRGRGKLVFRSPPVHLDKAEVDGKRHIVFTSYYPYPSLVKKSILLRQTGRYYTTILACCLREDSTPLSFFDQAYEVENYKELLHLLSFCAPWCVHAVIQPGIFGCIAIAAKKMSGIKTVIDINDTNLFIDHDPASPECLVEQRILQEADSFLHKMPKEAIHEMRDVWKVDTPDRRIWGLPYREIFTHCKNYSDGEPVEIVFAGGVIPYEIAKSRGYENHIFDPFIKKTAGEGRAKLTFLVNQNARTMCWKEHKHYFDLERAYPGFSFRKGVPFFQLPGRLARFHFGVYYENCAKHSYNPKHFTYNMPSKIFSYLEGGLPILVHDRAAYARRLVVEHGIGLVYEFERPERIPDLVKASDYDRLKSAVEEYRQKNELSSALCTLEKAYGTT